MRTKFEIAAPASLVAISLVLTGCHKENERVEVPRARVENGQVIVEPEVRRRLRSRSRRRGPPAAVTLALNGRIVWDDT